MGQRAGMSPERSHLAASNWRGKIWRS